MRQDHREVSFAWLVRERLDNSELGACRLPLQNGCRHARAAIHRHFDLWHACIDPQTASEPTPAVLRTTVSGDAIINDANARNAFTAARSVCRCKVPGPRLAVCCNHSKEVPDPSFSCRLLSPRAPTNRDQANRLILIHLPGLTPEIACDRWDTSISRRHAASRSPFSPSLPRRFVSAMHLQRVHLHGRH